MSKLRRTLISVLAVGAAASVAVVGAFSAFSATTANTGNSISTGTVALEDNDAGSVLYNVTNTKPGDTVERCIRVTYTGSLGASVKLYMPDAVGALGQYLDLMIIPGTQATPSFPNCGGFVPSGAAIYTGTLQGFSTAHPDWANGLPTVPASASSWMTNDAVVYRIVATVQDNQNAAGRSTSPHSFVWEARNN